MTQSKEREALKLALEAVEWMNGDTRPTPSKPFKEIAKAIREALAEQPPCKTGSQCTSKCPQCDEPDGMHHNKPHKCKYPKCPYPCPDLPDCRDAEQPARKPWVGLTDAEFQWIYDNGRTPAGMMELVETKLKEKNA